MGYLNGDPDQSDWPGSSRPGRYASATFGLVGYPFTQHRWETELLDGRYAVTCESLDGDGRWVVGIYKSEAAFYHEDDESDVIEEVEFAAPDEAAEYVARKDVP